MNSEVDSKVIDFAEIETFEAPQVDISSAWGMGLLGVVAGFAFAPVVTAGLFGGLIGFFGTLFTSSENIRAKQISRILERSKDRYEITFEKLKIAYEDSMDNQTNAINMYVRRKLNLFFDDLQSQMNKFDRPLTESEVEAGKDVLNQIKLFQQRLNDFDAELRSYLFTY